MRSTAAIRVREGLTNIRANLQRIGLVNGVHARQRGALQGDNEGGEKGGRTRAVEPFRILQCERAVRAICFAGPYLAGLVVSSILCKSDKGPARPVTL
jgi:hypothetical protein